MTDTNTCQAALDLAFEDAALALGGVVATHPVPDDAVWHLARALDEIHARACERCGAPEITATRDLEAAEHPAVVHLLARLREREMRTMDRREGGVR